jgi:class 3 adenylate cyclase
MEFCLLGDTANAAARLEALGKEYVDPGPRACTIVVGEPTWKRLGPGRTGLRIGQMTLRGKQQTVGAYRIDAAAVRTAVDA